MEGSAVLIFVAFITLMVVLAYFSHAASARRASELGALALQLGWQFDAAKDYDHDEHYGYLSIFDQGDDRYAYNTLLGAIDVGGRSWPARCGDYHYETTSGSGKDRKTHSHHLSYVLIETPHLGAPDLFIRREGMWDRFAGFLGFDDIDFESAEFSEKFHVKSSNKRFAYRVLEPRMMEFLLDSTTPTVEFRRGFCCLHDRERTFTAQEFDAVIAWAREFFSRWPREIPTVLDA